MILFDDTDSNGAERNALKLLAPLWFCFITWIAMEP
jgi:hypothetical protein